MLQILYNVGVIKFSRKEKKSYGIFRKLCIQIDMDILFFKFTVNMPKYVDKNNICCLIWNNDRIS